MNGMLFIPSVPRGIMSEEKGDEQVKLLLQFLKLKKRAGEPTFVDFKEEIQRHISPQGEQEQSDVGEKDFLTAA